MSGVDEDGIVIRLEARIQRDGAACVLVTSCRLRLAARPRVRYLALPYLTIPCIVVLLRYLSPEHVVRT